MCESRRQKRLNTHHMIEAFLDAVASDPAYAECSGEIMQFLMYLDKEERDNLIRGYLNEKLQGDIKFQRLQHKVEKLERDRAELQERLKNLQRRNEELRRNDVAK